MNSKNIPGVRPIVVGSLSAAITATLFACAVQHTAVEEEKKVEVLATLETATTHERDKAPVAQRAVPPNTPPHAPKLEAPPRTSDVVIAGNAIREVPQEIAMPIEAFAAQDLAQQGAPSVVELRANAGPSGGQPRKLANLQTITRAVAPQPSISLTPPNTEKYDHQDDNPIHLVSEQPVSTFSIDVDTGAYANVRRYLNGGQLPPQDAVRVEEMINYFDYSYAPPTSRTTPFKVATELSPTPWNANSLLLRIGIKGFEVAASERPPANLVFLIDVSGSMSSSDKLPLLKNAFKLLTEQMTAKDRVSMVVYAGSSGVVLEPTPGNQKHKIHEAIERLEAGGSTNGAQGIKLAYQLAHDAHIDKGINRVVLATDGDFNVGVVNYEALVDMAERQRATGVALTTLGFGTGNYNDRLLERLADAGNGNYAYVDTLNEARKVLVSELSSTLFTIAKDVKIQVEFNPAEVLEYRLIGYENRKLAREDFNNDKVDAGEIGAGHRVTAIYEIVPAGGKGRVDPLRYGARSQTIERSGELANVRVRFKQPDSDTSSLLEYPVAKSSFVPFEKASTDFRFAASVAAFGQLLRGGKYVEKFSYDDVAKVARGAMSEDAEGYRREFVSLVKLADSLTPKSPERVSRIAK